MKLLYVCVLPLMMQLASAQNHDTLIIRAGGAT